MSQAIGSPERPYAASLAILDDTGLTIAVATGGTYQPVLHATTMVAGDTAAGLTAAPAAGTITIPVGASGKYQVDVTGVCLPANSKTVLLRTAVGGTNLAVEAGGAGARIVGAASALEEHFAFSSLVDIDAATAAKAVSVNVTSTSNADNVNFKRLNIIVKRVGA